jgi:branched-chain amino acid transport system substrate-binding protein
MNKLATAAVTSLFLAPLFPATGTAQVTVGVILGATGQSSSLGIPEKNAIEMLPQTMAGVAVKYVILDDGGDPGAAVKNMRQLTEESKADVIIGSTSVPTALALADTALKTKTPQISLAPMPTNAYTFCVPQSADLMVAGLIGHMKTHGVKTLAYIGFSDALGDHNLQSTNELAGPAGIKIVTDERYSRTDTSVTAQVLKIVLANPDAVFVSAAGTPAALPQIELAQRGYKKQSYFLHGVINKEFLRVGGKYLDGIIATAGPFAVADDLPETNPIRAEAIAFKTTYDAKYGAGSANTFAAYAWDAGLLLKAALPAALEKAKPGTVEFREALREALETGREVVGADAVYAISAKDHNGLDDRARVLVTVKDGAFHLVK